ncbi:hypothetical protein BCR43DRAFT_492459 [Syncephalastrum racemosum]|uniref:ARS-binding protein 1 N-terminal domain-containing protein n=1 Tax=Syncephalastrum racemosum TaxID=13706 RepID=A0A1X2HF14_SYNRA|nr:hypothetical protein BCR43DRAFT_492459 [Syncephalastrum racemosum]
MGKNNTTTRLNNEQRLEICSKWKEMHKVWTQKQLATWVHAEYGVDISQAAISKLLKKRDQEGDGNDVEGSINESTNTIFQTPPTKTLS